MSAITPEQEDAIINGADEPDIDICRECGEHASFEGGVSECCGARAYESDPNLDMER